MVNTNLKEQILKILSGISDPEIPVVSIIDMGMVRDVELKNDLVVIVITPTYSGCPAMRQIEDDIVDSLLTNGIENAVIENRLFPPWSTDLMSEETKNKLKEYGIAPPIGKSSEISIDLLPILRKINCPFCNSDDTIKKSEFGSTACKAYYYCNSCVQNFEYFKCH